MARSCSSTSENNAVIKSMVVVIDSSVPRRVARLQPVWRKCMTTTRRPVSTMVLIGLSETNTIGYYCGARYYAPWFARWVSGDPAQLVDGLNAYSYAKNSPCRFNDPNGLWGHDMHFGAVYLAGRLEGASHAEALQAAIAS